MKKASALLSIILITILCLACDSKEIDEVVFESGIYFDKDWNEATGTYQGDVIPDRERAMSVATSIFDGMDKSEQLKKYTVKTIFYDEQDKIWIVSFGQESEDIVGGDCSIALQKSDGKVLRIWFGE